MKQVSLLLIVLIGLFVPGIVFAQEPTPTPHPTPTPMPTRTPVATPLPTPYFDSGAPENIGDGLIRSLSAAREVATTVRDAAGTSLIERANEFGNDLCVATGVLYAGQGILGSYLTTTLISVAIAMLIISLIRMGLWIVRFIIQMVRIL